MNKLLSILACLVLWSGLAAAEPVLDEATVKGISAEILQAIKDADIAPFEKYLHPQSKITIDLDPSLSAGEVDISYDQYMGMLEMSLPLMQEAEIHDEVLSVSVDSANNQATIREKTSATMDMFGVKVRDVSITETTYGVIDGEIKVLIAKDQLLSSGPVE